MEDQHTFFTRAVRKLETLDPNQKPEWGSMTPQHMVEHVISSWMISNGKAEAEQKVPDSEIQERLDFLRGDVPFPKDIKNPIHKDGLPNLRKDNLSQSVNQLAKEMNDFDKYFDKNPDAMPVHPIFGPIDKLDWLRFQEKHMLHHLRQFNLM